MEGVIEIALPPPPSVNKLRRYNFAHAPAHKHWIKLADGYVLADGLMRQIKPIEGEFIADLTFDERLRASNDLDNGIKACLDYAVRLGLIKDDSRKYLRELHVYWGTIPRGCLLVLRSLNSH